MRMEATGGSESLVSASSPEVGSGIYIAGLVALNPSCPFVDNRLWNWLVRFKMYLEAAGPSVVLIQEDGRFWFIVWESRQTTLLPLFLQLERWMK